MKQSANYVSKSRRFIRLKTSIAVAIFLFLIEILAIWSFGSFSVLRPGESAFLRFSLWFSHLSTPLLPLSIMKDYILDKLWICALVNLVLILILWLSSRRRSNYRDVEEGSAHWAFWRELKLFRKKENNQPLAEAVYMTKEADLPNGNVLVVAGPGEGKSFRMLTPAIIQACRDGYEKPSMIITDTKGALFRETAKHVMNQGLKVRVLNLTNPKYSWQYNPLCCIHQARLQTELASLVRCFIANTRDVETNAGDAFWEDTLYFLLMSVWAYQCTYQTNPVTNAIETKAMYRTLELIRGLRLDSNGKLSPDCEYSIIVDHIREENPLHITVTSFDSLTAAAPETIQSVVITAIARLAVFGEEAIELLTMDDELDIDGIFEEPTALYLNFEVGSAYKVIAAMFLEQCFASAYYIADTKHGGRLPLTCKMFLDEIANICKFHSLPERLSTARSYNIEITLCLQALQQLEKLYEGSDQTIINNCAVFAYLGCSEPDTLERISDMLGKTTIDEVSESRNYGTQGGGSSSDRRTGRPLMTKDELLTMNRENSVLVIRGHNPIYAPKCRTEKWSEYKYLGGRNKKNNVDISALCADMYNRHKEAYDADKIVRIERIRRLAQLKK